jgi:type 1 glutamine amidotransferase
MAVAPEHRSSRAARVAAAASSIACAAGAAVTACADRAPLTAPLTAPVPPRAAVAPPARAADAGRLLESQLAPGKCLDVAGGSTAEGAPVILWPCHGGANQRFVAAADGTWRVYPDGVTPRCLDAAGGALRDGDPLVAWSCHGGDNQRWTLSADGALEAAGGACLDLLAFDARDGAQPAAWRCNGGANQRFRARDASGGCVVPRAPAGARVLVFTRTAGFRHESIPAAVAAVRELGGEHGFEVDHTEDPAAFEDGALARYAAVVFLLTTGDVLGAEQEGAVERFVRAGGGFVGVHSAADTEYGWPWYGGLVGAYFRDHGPVGPATVTVVDGAHPSTRCAPAAWTRVDEWYEFRGPPAAGVRVLASVDSPAPHPIAWAHAYDGGRAWYTGLGHTAESYGEPAFRAHLAGGIVWAATR